jgi:hypothetical protein
MTTSGIEPAVAVPQPTAPPVYPCFTSRPIIMYSSHDSVVSTVTNLRAGRSGVRISAGAMVCLLSKRSRPAVQWVPRFFYRHDVEHPSASSAQVKKRGAIIRSLLFTLMAWTETAFTYYSEWAASEREHFTITMLHTSYFVSRLTKKQKGTNIRVKLSLILSNIS